MITDGTFFFGNHLKYPANGFLCHIAVQVGFNRLVRYPVVFADDLRPDFICAHFAQGPFHFRLERRKKLFGCLALQVIGRCYTVA